MVHADDARESPGGLGVLRLLADADEVFLRAGFDQFAATVTALCMDREPIGVRLRLDVGHASGAGLGRDIAVHDAAVAIGAGAATAAEEGQRRSDAEQRWQGVPRCHDQSSVQTFRIYPAIKPRTLPTGSGTAANTGGARRSIFQLSLRSTSRRNASLRSMDSM